MADAVGEHRAARYREVFGVAEFRALFGAHLLSVIGDQFARIALTVLVFDRTGSAALTAMTYALTFLPAIVAGPLLSGLADRHPRRQVMILTDLARAVLVAAMAVPGMPLAALCALLVLVQLLAAPFEAARAATLPVVLGGGDRYVVASSVSNMTYQLAQLIGFVTGGVLVLGVSASGALLVDSATFVVSALLIRLGVTARPAPSAPDSPDPAAGLRGWGGRIAAGAGLVWSDRRLRALTALLCVTAFAVTIEGLAVPYAYDLGLGAAAVGLLLAADPAGSLLGMLAVNRLRPRRRLRLMRPLAVASPAVLVVCAGHPGLMLTVAVWMVSGAASAYTVVANAELVRAVPDHRRGQAFGLVATALRASQGLAVLAAGVAAEVVRPGLVIAVAGVAGALVAVAAGTAWVRADASAGAAPDEATRPS